MSEFAVKGPEIKSLIKVAKKGPIPFAFNPGKADNEHLLAMHRRKPAALLGKSAKQDGPGNKAAFGTCEVDGKVLSLTCEKTVPNLAKRLKKYLKSQKVSLNVRVLDAAGNVLEDDIEDLPDDDLLDDDDGVQAQEAAPAGDAEAPVDQIDARELIARLQAVSARAKAAPAEVVQKLTAAVGEAANQVKAQALEVADGQITKLEQALDRLDGQGSAPPAAPPNPMADTLAKAIAATESSLQALQGEAQEKLNQALGMVRDLVSAEDYNKAANGLKSIRDQIAKLTSQPDAEPAQEEQAEAPQEPVQQAEAAPPRPKISVVAFQRSRLMWLDTKRALQSGLDTLKNAIIAQADGDEDKDDIVAAATEMADRINDFDTLLEDVLDDITNTPDGPDRDRLRSKATGVIREYNSILDAPFFKALDANPFTKLDVVGSAKQSLALIQKTLA